MILWDLLLSVLYMISRYLHIVCTTLLVGGTLFFEMVVPIAISELRSEHQLAVFARARWVFRRIVWISVVLLLITGVVSTYTHWDRYTSESALVEAHPRDSSLTALAGMRSGWWWAAHASTGLMSLLIAVGLTMRRRPPEHPVEWMRINLVILMLVMFLATATRHVRNANDQVERDHDITATSVRIQP